MVQTSVDICNNVNLNPEMCLRRGEVVYSPVRPALRERLRTHKVFTKKNSVLP